MKEIQLNMLVLGKGFSGLSAALSLSKYNRSLDVNVLDAAIGPSGSSFANQNNALGVQVHENDEERKAFFDKVMEIAPPGTVDPRLVSLLAEESCERFEELVALGLKFDTDENGRWKKFPACFAPELKHARVFRDLRHAYSLCYNQAKILGCRFIHGYQVREILIENSADGPRASGALIRNFQGQEVLIRSQVVIAALGGTAGRYRYNVAPPGNAGDSHYLIEQAGVEMINKEFMQFMWYTVSDRQFVNISRLLSPEAKIKDPKGKEIVLPGRLLTHAQSRASHCPVAYKMKDREIDEFLIDCQNDDGLVEAYLPDKGWFKMAMMAHASNGGALIDGWGRTNIKGLYCVGECASGMHGANRIGGAMILATQVFGRRAGIAAAEDTNNGLF